MITRVMSGEKARLHLTDDHLALAEFLALDDMRALLTIAAMNPGAPAVLTQKQITLIRDLCEKRMGEIGNQFYEAPST